MAGRYDVIGRLPPGGKGKTSLAWMLGQAGFRRLVVLRPVDGANLLPVTTVDPHLPAALSVDEIDGKSVAAYDFFPGASLKEILEVYRGQGQLPPLGLSLRIVADAARVLHAAHEHQDPLGGTGALVHGAIADETLLLG